MIALRISVVCPVYNVRSYLTETVNSVFAQTCPDWELVLVNDGSTDGSDVLCDELAEQDNRVRVIHQENSGPSCARNIGLSVARGDYILFIDSDDFYRSQESFEKLLAAADGISSGADMVIFSYARYRRDTGFGKRAYSLAGLTQDDYDAAMTALARRNAYQSSACCKMVKRELLENMQFRPGITCEDIEWSAALMLRARNIALVDEAIYAYRIRKGSISQSVSIRTLENLLAIIERLAHKNKTSTEQSSYYYSYVAFQYCTLLLNWQLCKPKPDDALKARAKKLAPLLRQGLSSPVRMARLAYSLVGFDLTGKLMLPFRS